MKRIWLCRVLITLMVAIATPACVMAQDIFVHNGHNIVIDDNETVVSRLKGTDFGRVASGDFKVFAFSIANSHFQLLSLTAPVEISGSTDFTIVQPPSGPIERYIDKQLFVVFSPTSLGLKTATITIKSNDPDAENVYVFNVSGTSNDGVPAPTPDFMVTDFSVDPTEKVNKKTGERTITWRIRIANISEIEAPEGPLVIFYISTDEFLDSGDTQIGDVFAKKVTKGAVPGKPLKSKVVKIKANVGTIPGKYVLATIVAVSYDENNVINNYTGNFIN